MKRTIKNAIALAATLFGSIVLPASAMAQSAPDTVRTESLEAMARVWGGRDGHIRATDAAGGSTILAYGASTWAVYTSGDGVSATDDFAFCTEDATGGLSSCDTVEDDGTAALDCNYGWCSCNNKFDCTFAMAYACSAPMTCDWDGCTCPVW